MFFVNYFRKCWLRVISFVSSELSPQKIGLAFAIGIPLGIVPFFCGLNVLLSFLFAWRLRLNHLLIQTISSIIYPLQVLLYVPFMRLGVLLFSSDEMLFSTRLILSSFHEDALETLRLIGIWNLYAILVWGIVALPLGIIIYRISYRIAYLRVKSLYQIMTGSEEDAECDNEVLTYYQHLEEVSI